MWFPDLTQADPMYVLPVLASGFLLATIEVCFTCCDANHPVTDACAAVLV